MLDQGAVLFALLLPGLAKAVSTTGRAYFVTFNI